MSLFVKVKQTSHISREIFIYNPLSSARATYKKWQDENSFQSQSIVQHNKDLSLTLRTLVKLHTKESNFDYTSSFTNKLQHLILLSF